MDKFSLKAIKKAMADRNIGTQKELVKLSGLAMSTISRVFAGTAKPEAATVTALMKALNLTRAELFGESAPLPQVQQPMDLNKEVFIEIIGKVWATPFRISIGHGLGRYIRGKPGEQGFFGLEVEGNSMEPIYLPGDVIICRPFSVKLSSYSEGDDSAFVPYERVSQLNNQDVVVTLNGETNLKRIKVERTRGPKYDIHMVSMNPQYPPVRVAYGDEWEVQAIVRRHEKPDVIEWV